MNISPVLYIFKSAPYIISGRAKKALSKADFSSELNKILVDFKANVETIKLKLTKLKIKNSSLNIERYTNGFTSDFAQVEIYLANNGNLQNPTREHIESIAIYADFYGKKLKFTIVPNRSATAYNINKDPNARARTEALEAITRSLFKASNSDIAITSSDENAKDHSNITKLEQLIPNSKFTFFKSVILSELKKDLENGNLPINFTKDFGTFVEVSVTDQPFSLSSYNSDGTSPGIDYYRRCFNTLNRKKKK